MRIRVCVAAALALCAPVALAASNRPAGEFDSSFGHQGRVFVRVGGYSEAGDLVVQSDRKVVLAGIVGDSPYFDFLALRLNRNGSRDRSFGNGGIVRTSIELGGMHRAELAAVAQGSQGAIVLAGKAWKSEGGLTDFAVVRLKPSGALDTSFSDDGVQTIDLRPEDSLSDVAVQPDGKLLLVGSWSSTGFIVIRLLSNGALDSSFGSGGVVETNIGHPSLPDAAADAAVLGDGRIVVSGTADFACYGAATDFAVVRYLPDGRRDPTFGEDGIVTTTGPAREVAAALVVTSDEMIVVLGNEGGCLAPLRPAFYRFHLARYLPTGALDPRFGTGGTVTTSITTGNWAYSYAESLAVEGDAKIIAGGFTGTYYPAEGSAALVRYNEDGTLDHTFGVSGKRRYPLASAVAIGIQPLAARSGADRLVMALPGSQVGAAGIDLGSIVRCRVPHVVGLTLPRARARIRAAHCRVGRVRRARSARRRGRVIAQRPRAGRRLPGGTRVGLVVSKGS